MKRLLVVYVAFAITLLLGINVFNAVKEVISSPTDEEIMNEYICEHYGDQCYGELVDCNEKDIDFLVYDQNGDVRYSTTIDREYYSYLCNE